jgi:methyl-accepting chemotaxis protein
VVDAQGRLIAHPDISLVLRNTDMSRLAQVQAARMAGSKGTTPTDGPTETVQESENIEGRKVLTAYASVAPLGWLVFVELPAEEAYAPLYAALKRLGYVLLAALVIAVFAGMFLAGRMVGPIQALRAGAARIGSGDLRTRPGAIAPGRGLSD